MNFAAVVGASLRSGSALPACRPDNGKPHRQPAECHLSSGGICPDKAGQLKRRFGIPLDMHRAGKTVEVYARRRTLVFNWRLLTRWVKRWDGEIVCHAPNNATIHAKYKVANCRF